MVEALLCLLSPDDYINNSVKKLKGLYATKKKVPFLLKDIDLVINELREKNHSRYNDQIDFTLVHNKILPINPFIGRRPVTSPLELSSSILYKEFRNYLDEKKPFALYRNTFFQELRGGQSVLVIDNFAEIWYHQDRLYSISLIHF